jgi:hypothetical protein
VVGFVDQHQLVKGQAQTVAHFLRLSVRSQSLGKSRSWEEILAD